MKPLTKTGAVAAVVALALPLTGCVESGRTSGAVDTECPWQPDESIDTTARIAWQPIPNGDLVVKDLGILEACMPNATIKWQQAASGGDVVKYYGSGDIDLGLMGSSPAVIASSEPVMRDADIQVVWIHDVIGTAESLIVRDPAQKTLEDLKGRTIAVPFSSTAHYSLLQAIADAGLDANKDFKIINLDPEKMLGAWQGDEIDAAWVWEPVQSQLLEDGGARILSSEDTAEAGKPTFDLGTASTQFIEQNPDFMEQWARAQDYAVTMIKDDPKAAADSAGVQLNIDPATARKQFEGYVYLNAAEQAGPDYLGGKMAEDMATTAKFLLDQGGIEKAGPVDQYAEHVDDAPAAAAAKADQ